MRASIELGLCKYQPGARDARGNPIDSWAAPAPIFAYSIGPSYSTEKSGQTVATGLVVGLPESYSITPKDRVQWRNATWTIEGELIDANLGPFGYRPGWVMTIRRVSG